MSGSLERHIVRYSSVMISGSVCDRIIDGAEKLRNVKESPAIKSGRGDILTLGVGEEKVLDDLLL